MLARHQPDAHSATPPEAGFTSWNVYEGDLDVLKATGVGKTVFSLVTGVKNGVEGSLGRDSAGRERLNGNPCPSP